MRLFNIHDMPNATAVPRLLTDTLDESKVRPCVVAGDGSIRYEVGQVFQPKGYAWWDREANRIVLDLFASDRDYTRLLVRITSIKAIDIRAISFEDAIAMGAWSDKYAVLKWSFVHDKNLAYAERQKGQTIWDRPSHLYSAWYLTFKWISPKKDGNNE